MDRNTKVMLWTAYLFQLEAASLDYTWPPSESGQERAEYLEALASRGIEEAFHKAGLVTDRERTKAWRDAVKAFSEVKV
jgi:hypothetical protein